MRMTLDEHLKEIDFSGVVSIYRGEEPYYEEAFGYRDKPNTAANNANTLFGIASGTKTFTAAGILKLVDAGELALSTPVGKIAGASASYIHRDATIRQLLNHSSGIHDYYDEEVVTDFDNFKVDIPWCELETPSDYLPLFEGKKMKFPPGTRVSYSNSGYVFLGVIIERITGMKYRDYMKRQVFEPLGMESTDLYAFNDLPGNTAWGYMWAGESWVSNIYKLPVRGGGDGGLYTNADDMRTFWNNLFHEEYLSSELVKEMTGKEVEVFPGQKYGLGIYISEFARHTSYAAGGVDCGVGFSSSFVPDSGLTISILSNVTDGARGILSHIEDELPAGA